MQNSSRHIWISGNSGRALRLILLTVTVVMIVVTTGCPPPPPPVPPAVPTDAQDACPLDAPTFAGWFQPSSVIGGVVQINGIVNPAYIRPCPPPNLRFYHW